MKLVTTILRLITPHSIHIHVHNHNCNHKTNTITSTSQHQQRKFAQLFSGFCCSRPFYVILSLSVVANILRDYDIFIALLRYLLLFANLSLTLSLSLSGALFH